MFFDLIDKLNHLMSVFIYHRLSHTPYVDDAINYIDKFDFLLKLFGITHGVMALHPSIKTSGLHSTAELRNNSEPQIERPE